MLWRKSTLTSPGFDQWIARGSPANPKLTERDRALLRYILKGLTNREIGTHLQISEGAVKSSLSVLFEKLNVKTRTQLVKVALEEYQGDQL